MIFKYVQLFLSTVSYNKHDSSCLNSTQSIDFDPNLGISNNALDKNVGGSYSTTSQTSDSLNIDDVYETDMDTANISSSHSDSNASFDDCGNNAMDISSEGCAYSKDFNSSDLYINLIKDTEEDTSKTAIQNKSCDIQTNPVEKRIFSFSSTSSEHSELTNCCSQVNSNINDQSLDTSIAIKNNSFAMSNPNDPFNVKRNENENDLPDKLKTNEKSQGFPSNSYNLYSASVPSVFHDSQTSYTKSSLSESKNKSIRTTFKSNPNLSPPYSLEQLQSEKFIGNSQSAAHPLRQNITVTQSKSSSNSNSLSQSKSSENKSSGRVYIPSHVRGNSLDKELVSSLKDSSVLHSSSPSNKNHPPQANLTRKFGHKRWSSDSSVIQLQVDQSNSGAAQSDDSKTEQTYQGMYFKLIYLFPV